MVTLRPWAVGLLLGFRAMSVMADTATAKFDVRITLSTEVSPGICISQSLSDALGAIVKVVCNTRQFVSIQQSPTKSFLGTVGNVGHIILDANASSTSSTSNNSSIDVSASVPDNGAVSAANSSSEAGSIQRSESAFKDSSTGERAATPSLSQAQASALAKYRHFFGDATTEITQPLNIINIPGAPIEMLIAF
jgi:hypothetical protein